MTSTQVHTLPLSWDDARDIPFFRITARLFPAEFCLGASVLLASNDDVTAGIAPQNPEPPAPRPHRLQRAATARTSDRSARTPAQAPAGELL